MDPERRETLREDDRLAAATAAVLERAEAGDGTVRRADVADAVPARQWGRLLETGLLVAAGDRFVVDDPTAVREVLADRPSTPDVADFDDPDPVDGDDSGGWRPVDKAAGVCSLALMASYQLPPARDAIGSTMHLVFGPLEAALPFAVTVAVLALVVGSASTLLNRRLRDAERAERLRERLQSVGDRLEAARERGDEAAVDRLEERQRELLGDQVGAFADLLRPMAWTVLLSAPVFLWLSWLVVAPAAAVTPTAAVVPFVGRIAWTARLVGPLHVWTVWYVVCSLVSGVAVGRATDRIGGLAAA